VPDWPPRSGRIQPTLTGLRHYVSRPSGEGEHSMRNRSLVSAGLAAVTVFAVITNWRPGAKTSG